MSGVLCGREYRRVRGRTCYWPDRRRSLQAPAGQPNVGAGHANSVRTA